MKSRAVLLAATLFATVAHGQATRRPIPDDWTAIQSMPAGTPIVIKPRYFSVKCEFVSANQDGLSCRSVTHSWILGDRVQAYDFPRQNVHWVRHEARKGTFVGALIGVAGGVILGATSPNSYNSSDRVVLEGLGGLLGGFWGALIGRLVDDFRNFNPGRSPIYFRP